MSQEAPRPRGRAGLYALAFLLMMAAGAVLLIEVRSFLDSTRLLWVSTGLSAAALLVAIASVMLRSRK